MTCSLLICAIAGLYDSKSGKVGLNIVSLTYAERCGSAGSSQNGSSLAIPGIGIDQRPSPPLRYSFNTFGWIAYFRKSLATSTFFAPLGIAAPKIGIGLANGFPSLPSGIPRVKISSY